MLADEQQVCTQVFQHHLEAYEQRGESAEQAYQHALANVCQVVFSTNEFIYIQ